MFHNWIEFVGIVWYVQAVTFGTFVIASGFFNVYSMGVETLFICFRKSRFIMQMLVSTISIM